MATRAMEPGDAPPDESPDLRGYVETTPDGETVYTAAPVDVSGYERMSCWVTVPTSLVADLEEMR